MTLVVTQLQSFNPHGRRLHTKEHHDLCSSPITIQVIKLRRMTWTRHATRIRVGIGAYRVLAGKPERKRPLGRSKHRWEDSIKIDLAEYDGGGGGLELY
jgi:hypothetical protein